MRVVNERDFRRLTLLSFLGRFLMMNALAKYICREILGAGNIACMVNSVSTLKFKQLIRLVKKYVSNII